MIRPCSIGPCSIGLVLCALATGCATTSNIGDGADIDETLALGVAESFANHLIARNFDGVMALISENFEDPTLGDRSGFRSYLERANERGYFERAELKSFPVEADISGRSANIYPIEIQADFGVAVYALSLRAERTGWMITGIRTELY